MTLTTLKQYRCLGGTQGVFAHESTATGTRMEFALYLPPQAERGPVPVLYWLSGLTCTWANFTEKAGAQRYAAEHGIMIVAPDTSPRGTDLPGEHNAYDFGSGAGFYVDATELVKGSDWRTEILVDQGTADEFLERELKPQLLLEACQAAGIPLTLRYQAGYDHSYYTMASFMADHLAHHARLLNRRAQDSA